ncbi:hypothetical protein KIPB_011662 [Kipferlia bialata]|uniref:CCDC81 HU domain-containing protein n=1 Tax=Kipferlia bialata TaxID=797122 RepID=A0A391NQE9_9EUKA|nr:hypothetical protein KIPB_011662 [Kipferlia bialata]|eukprot:g11662.t1
MAPFVEQTLFESAIKNPKCKDRQAFLNNCYDVWAHLKHILTDLFLDGSGIVLPNLGAFIYRNSMENGSPLRTPAFVFMPEFLDKSGCRCPAGQKMGHRMGNLGSLYERHPPLQALSWSAVAQRVGGLSAAEARQVYDVILDELLAYVGARRVGRLDFGLGVLQCSSEGTLTMRLSKSVMTQLKGTGVLNTTKTFQAMRSLGTFRPSESSMESIRDLHK